MSKKIIFIILFFIIVVAAFFRFYKLQVVPPSASLDEVSIGWNAYSILQTGKDEYGTRFPILLRAYDDYRPALYVYTVIPFVKIFGLNALSVRLPSAIFSVLTVLATYFLVKELFKRKGNGSILLKSLSIEYIALIVTFLLAISPWHIYMSRLGHEVNLAFSAFVFALYFFLRKNIYLSSLFFFLSFISYQTEKIFIPIIVLAIFFIFKDELYEFRKKILISIFFGFLLLVPFLKESFSGNGLIRFNATNVLKANEHRFIEQSKDLNYSFENNNPLAKIIYNRRILSFQILAEGYLTHFNPTWLFSNLSGEKHKVPNIGLMYLWELPFVLIGLYMIIRINIDKKIKKLIFVWFLASPIAASLTTDTPHALRSLVFLPTWQIFSALGLVSSLFYFKRFFRIIFPIGLLILCFSLLYFYEQYFYVFPKSQSKPFQYSLSKTIPFVLEREKDYKKIVFSNSGSLHQSYMFFLFYSKYDPNLYQKQGGTGSGGYDKIHKFGKYEFKNIDIKMIPKGSLYVANYSEVDLSKKLDVIKTFKDLDGENSIMVIKK